MINFAHVRRGIDFCGYSNKRLHGRPVLPCLNACALAVAVLQSGCHILGQIVGSIAKSKKHAS